MLTAPGEPCEWLSLVPIRQAAFDLARPKGRSKRTPRRKQIGSLVEPDRGAGMLMIVAYREGGRPLAYRLDQRDAEELAQAILEVRAV